jgi:serine/threonine protein kinase
MQTQIPMPVSFGDGRYSVQMLLGEGGMARVYLAMDTRLQRVVAIKVPKPHLLHSPRVIQRFAQEAETMARAAHPNAVPLFDAAAELLFDGTRTPYLVMELVRGVSIEDIVLSERKGAFGPLHPRTASRIILAVLSALAEFHMGGLIHRDIKPSNLMVGWNPDMVRIMDFGIARIALEDGGDGQRNTKTQASMFSPGYSAPEQMLSAKDAGPRADLFAVGATLYVMLTGREVEAIYMHDLDSADFQAVPVCLRMIIHGATRYKPSDRVFGTAEDMAEAIRNAVCDEPESDESAFHAWLAKRRDASPVEAAIRRAFGHRYTIVPEVEETASASEGFTRWFEEGEAGQNTRELTPVALPPPVRSVARRYLPEIAVTGLAAAFIVLIVVIVSRLGLFDPGWTSETVAMQADAIVMTTEPAVESLQAESPQATDKELDPSQDPSSAPSSQSRGKRTRKVEKMPDASVPSVETISNAVVAPAVELVDVPAPEPVTPKGTIRLAGGASAITLIGSDGASFPSGSVPPGTYRIQAAFPEKGTASNAGSVTVAAGQSVSLTCNEAFKLCSGR